MPYPLQKLPYGLRQRLRELATSAEAYAFQIAAPNLAGLQPIQKLLPISNAWYKINEENDWKFSPPNSKPANSDASSLYLATYSVLFHNVTPYFKLSTILDDIRFAPLHLYLTDCVLDTAFVQSLINVVDKPFENVKLTNCSFTTEKAAKMLCNSFAFSALEDFAITEPAFPSVAWWIEALVDENRTSKLSTFCVSEGSASVFDIDEEVLVKFVKAQCEDFRLAFFMSFHWSSTLERLDELFSDHFECSSYESKSLMKKVVCLYFKNIDWYYRFKDE